MSPRVLRVHFRDDEGHLRIHAPGVGLVDVQCARSSDCWCEGLRLLVANRAEYEVQPLEQTRLGHGALDFDLLATHRDALTGAALRREQTQGADRQIGPLPFVQDAQELAANQACRADDANCVAHRAHSLPLALSEAALCGVPFGLVSNSSP